MLPRSDSSATLLSDIEKLGSAPSPPAASAANVPANVTVSEVMKRDLVTVSPETSTLDAIALMRRHRIGCLPVVKDGRIVAMVIEEDFMGIAADLLEQKIGALEPLDEPSVKSSTREKAIDHTAEPQGVRRPSR